MNDEGPIDKLARFADWERYRSKMDSLSNFYFQQAQQHLAKEPDA